MKETTQAAAAAEPPAAAQAGQSSKATAPPAQDKGPVKPAESVQAAVDIKDAPTTEDEKAAAKLLGDDPALAPGHQAVRDGRIDEARETFQHVIASAEKKEDPESKALLAAALAGMARVYLRTSEFDKLLECGQTLAGAAVGPAQQAVGERWIAVAHWRKGETEQALAHFDAAKAAAETAGSPGRAVLAEVLCDHAHLLRDAGRMAEAKKTVRAARRVLRTRRGPTVTGIDADLVEGGIAKREGRHVDAMQLFSSAHAGAKEIGSVRQRADAGISLGNVRYTMGDYERAVVPFEEALEIGKTLGDAGITGNAAMGLCALAVAGGDTDAAREHILAGLAGWEAAGDKSGMALARTNLALLSFDEQDWASVIKEADTLLELLAGGVDELRRARILSLRGEAQLESDDVDGAQASFETVLEAIDEDTSPRLVALAWAGLGRVARRRDDSDTACSWFRRAVEALALAKEESEAVQVRLDLAEALILANDHEAARHELSRARDQSDLLGTSDAERLETLEAQAAQ